MKLKELIDKLEAGARIRIFSGCMTLYYGKAEPSKRWNLRVLPYMDCKVLNNHTTNGIVIVVI